MACNRFSNFLLRGKWILFQKGGGLHDHSRRAKPALDGPCLHKGFLEGRENSPSGDSFNRDDFAAMGPVNGHRAAGPRLAIDQDDAGSAVARAATFLGSGQVKVVPEKIYKGFLPAEQALHNRAVYGQFDLHFAIHLCQQND